MRVRAVLTDWDLTRDGTPQFEGAEIGGRYSATAWVRVAPPEQVIEPGASAIVRFSASAAGGVEPGGYRTGILFEFEPGHARRAPRRELAFKSRIATLIYVNSRNHRVAAAELVDVRVRPTAAGVDVVATLKNSGRRTVRTRERSSVRRVWRQSRAKRGSGRARCCPRANAKSRVPVAHAPPTESARAGHLPRGAEARSRSGRPHRRRNTGAHLANSSSMARAARSPPSVRFWRWQLVDAARAWRAGRSRGSLQVSGAAQVHHR